MSHRFPFARAGQVIGLLGGSFDPAHEGHVHLSKEALKRFGLDQLWWLVSPANPLKTHSPALLERRMARARSIMSHPRVKVTDIERQLGTQYTAQTLAALMARYRGVRFVWLMGADNLAGFDQWRDWEAIMQMVPIGVLARPGARAAACHSKAATIYSGARVPARDAQGLGARHAPAWCFLNMPMQAQSSSVIRAAGLWERTKPAGSCAGKDNKA